MERLRIFIRKIRVCTSKPTSLMKKRKIFNFFTKIGALISVKTQFVFYRYIYPKKKEKLGRISALNSLDFLIILKLKIFMKLSPNQTPKSALFHVTLIITDH